MAEKDQDQEQEQEEPKSSKKKLIIIIAAVILLIGAAGGGFYFMSAGDSSTDEVTDVEEEPEEEALELLYFDLSKPFIVNYPKDSSARLVQISISLSVAGETAVAGLKKHEPMIRNNILMLMSAQDTSKLSHVAGKEKLRSILLDEINSVMLKMTQNEPVKELFFTAFVMQ